MIQKILGNITNAFIKSSDKRVKNDTYITFITNECVRKDDYVEIFLFKDAHHFKITDIEVCGASLSVQAVETGYWATKLERKKDFDLRSIIALQVTLIEDEKKISKIYTESCWC